MQRDGGPGGAGGAGNPVGGSFTGPAETLEIVGNHTYAYTGLIQADTASAVVLSFTTGNYYFVGEMQINSPLSQTAPQFAGIGAAHLSLNGLDIVGIKSGGSEQADDNPTSERTRVIIPSYTEVLVTVDSNVTTSESYISLSLVGRIYRG